MPKLSKLIDATTHRGLAAADQAKYQLQDDGHYQLVGDDTPAGDIDKSLPLFVKGDELDQLPDNVRVYYDQDWMDVDGKPGGEGVLKLRGFEDTSPLKNAYNRMKAERNLDKEKLERFENLNVDPDELVKLREMSQRLAQEKDLARSTFDKQFAEAADSYKSEIKVRDENILTLQKDLRKALIDDRAAMEVKLAGGTEEYLMPWIKSNSEVRLVDGTYRAVILGEDGGPRLKKGADKATDFLSYAEYVDELKQTEKWSAAFQGAGSSGAGTEPGRLAGETDAPAVVPKSDMRAIGVHAESIAKGKTKVR